MPVDERPNTTITHIESNEITKLSYHTINPDELAKGMINEGLKSKYFGVSQIAILSILAKSNNDLNEV